MTAAGGGAGARARDEGWGGNRPGAAAIGQWLEADWRLTRGGGGETLAMGMPTILDRYLLLEWVKVFALTGLVILGLLLLADMYDHLPDLLDYGATGGQVLVYYGVLIPSFLPLVLPVTLLVSILFCLGTLHRQNEIVAMRTGGLSLWRISRPLWVAAAGLAGSLFYLGAEVVPGAVETGRALVDTLRFSAEGRVGKDGRTVGQVDSLGFDNRKDGRLWFMNRFLERSYVAHGITVFTRDGKGREQYRLAAREAYYDELRGFWVFLDGRETVFDAEGNPLRSLGFDRQEMPAYTEDPQLMLALSRKPNNLSLLELGALLEQVRAEDNPRIHAYAVQYHKVLASPFGCLLVAGLAIPFAVMGVRVNPMVGVSKSAVYFLVYFFCSQFFSMLGEREYLQPWLAAWAPFMLMTLVAGQLLWKAR